MANQNKEVCTHGNSDPNACVKCTEAIVLANPVARAAYWANRCARRELEIVQLRQKIVSLQRSIENISQVLNEGYGVYRP